EKDDSGFTLVAPDADGDVPFDYMIVVKPKTNYGMGRFPQGLGPPGAPDVEAARAKNQPDMDNIFRWKPDHEVYNYKRIRRERLPQPPVKSDE
ncbi:hypothetical protein DRQ33_04970, partial [bacterium]